MAHFNPVTVATAHSQNSGVSGNIYAHIHRLHGASYPQLNTSDNEQLEWTHFTTDLPYRSSYPCFPTKEEAASNAKKRLCALPLNSFDSSQEIAPEMDHLDRYKWNKCHFLSLPKELRFKIYRNVLTDASVPDLLVDITREPFSPCYKLRRPPTPQITVSLRQPRNEPVNLNLLRTNRYIYEEALPILYSSATFAAWDLEGLLPLFLDTLSPYARSCVRNVKLYMPDLVTHHALSRDRSRPFFHWAITCAQVAKMNDSLHRVEIDGDWSIFDSKLNRRAILSPLCKIKAAKKFTSQVQGAKEVPDHNHQFQKLLVEAKQELKANAKLREERTKADALERPNRDETRKQKELQEHERRTRNYPWIGLPLLPSSEISSGEATHDLLEDHKQVEGLTVHDSMEDWYCWAEENLMRMEEDLSLVPGIKQFEKELEEHSRSVVCYVDRARKDDESTAEDWDLVSMRSGASTPKARPASMISKLSGGSWTDTASTIVGEDDIGKDDESDTESESWEYIGK